MSDEEQQIDGAPMPTYVEVDEVQDIPEEVLAQVRDLVGPGAPEDAPLPFLGVAYRQYNHTAPEGDEGEVLVEQLLTSDSFLLIQPAVEDGGVRFYITTDASVPEALGILGNTYETMRDGYERQEAELAARDEKATDYFQARAATCCHTPGGEGIEINDCHRCWSETGMPLLPYEVEPSAEFSPGSFIEQADEAIAITKEQCSDDCECKTGNGPRENDNVRDLFEQRNHVE